MTTETSHLDTNPWKCPYPNAIFHIELLLRNRSIIHYYILEHRKKQKDIHQPYIYEIIKVAQGRGENSQTLNDSEATIVAWCGYLSQAKDLIKVDMKKVRHRDTHQLDIQSGSMTLFV